MCCIVHKDAQHSIEKSLLWKQPAVDCDASLRDDASRTLLSYASQHGWQRVVALLLRPRALLPPVGVDTEDARGCTPLMTAAANGHANIVKQLLQHAPHSDDDNDSVLAADGGNRENTPLMLAAAAGHAAVSSASCSRTAAAATLTQMLSLASATRCCCCGPSRTYYGDAVELLLIRHFSGWRSDKTRFYMSSTSHHEPTE